MSETKRIPENTPGSSPKRSPETTPSGPQPKLKMGVPLQIISVGETDGKWEIFVQEDNLNSFITSLKKLGVKKLSVVSVLGQFRTGKSFLLDLMLRWFQYADSEWLQGSMTGESEHYFTYRKDKERVTTGIWVYSQPYIKNDVAIVLMDTQGLFDLKTPMDINKAVFSLTTLLSSYQILNVQNRIAEDTLQQLEFFTEFARSAIELNNKTAKKKIEINEFKFQHLEFLVRDWRYFEDGAEFAQCRGEMKKFVNDMLEQNSHDAGTRDRIIGMFDGLTCFGLPYPGKCVNKSNWDGNLEDLDPEFKSLVSMYFDDIFRKNIVEKQPLFPGQVMGADLFREYIKTFTGVFRSGELPEAVNLAAAFSKSIHFNAKEKALENYCNLMDELLATTTYVEDDEFNAKHNEAERSCRSLFETKAQYGKQEDRDAMFDSLQSKLRDTFSKYREVNKARMAALMNQYSLLVLVAFLAWVVDLITDYTCDWWSKECQKLSKVAWWIYMGAGIFLLVVGLQIYRQKGQIVLGKSLLGLSGETYALGVAYYRDLKQKYYGGGADKARKKSGRTPEGSAARAASKKQD